MLRIIGGEFHPEGEEGYILVVRGRGDRTAISIEDSEDDGDVVARVVLGRGDTSQLASILNEIVAHQRAQVSQ